MWDDSEFWNLWPSLAYEVVKCCFPVPWKAKDSLCFEFQEIRERQAIENAAQIALERVS